MSPTPRALFPRPHFSTCLDQPAVFQKEPLAAPDDRIAGEAPNPDAKPDQIAHRQQPEILQNLAIPEDSSAHLHRRPDAQKEGQPQQPDAPEADAGCQHIGHRQRQRMREKETDITPAAAVADGTRPAYLVAGKPGETVRGNAGFDDL